MFIITTLKVILKKNCKSFKKNTFIESIETGKNNKNLSLLVIALKKFLLIKL